MRRHRFRFYLRSARELDCVYYARCRIARISDHFIRPRAFSVSNTRGNIYFSKEREKKKEKDREKVREVERYKDIQVSLKLFFEIHFFFQYFIKKQ